MNLHLMEAGVTRAAGRGSPGFFPFCYVDRKLMIALCLGLFRSGGDRMSKPVKSDPHQTFEKALAELETIVSRMEGGQLSLEQSLTSYKRGAELLKFCQAQLADAQQQVKVLEAGVLKNFAGADDDDNR